MCNDVYKLWLLTLTVLLSANSVDSWGWGHEVVHKCMNLKTDHIEFMKANTDMVKMPEKNMKILVKQLSNLTREQHEHESVETARVSKWQ